MRPRIIYENPASEALADRLGLALDPARNRELTEQTLVAGLLV